MRNSVTPSPTGLESPKLPDSTCRNLAVILDLAILSRSAVIHSMNGERPLSSWY
jgi:hypothetical protein